MEPVEEDDNIDLFFEGVQVFRSKWNTLSERYRKLEASLAAAKIEKNQLQERLNSSKVYAKKVEKEKEELANVVRELYQDLKNNPLHRWIDTLGQKISSRNEPAQNTAAISTPHIVNETPFVIDDIILSNSSDENSCSDSSVFRRVNDTNSQLVLCDETSTPRSSTDDVGVSDHSYSSPENETYPSKEENIDQISDEEPCSPSYKSSNENTSTIDPTSANSELPVETSLNGEKMSSVDSPPRNAASNEENADDALTSSLYSPQKAASVDNGTECSALNGNENNFAVSRNFSVDKTTLTKPSSRDEKIFVVISPEVSVNSSQSIHLSNSDEFESIPNRNESADRGEGSEISNAISPISSEYAPQAGVLFNDNAEVLSINENVKRSNDSQKILTSEKTSFEPSSRPAVSTDDDSSPRKESPTSAEFCEDRSDEYCIDERVSNELLLQQGVNHEEILSAGESPSLNKSPDYRIFSSNDEEKVTLNGDKSKNPGGTPEELLSQIFGSPSMSPDRNSDLICTTNEPCSIGLNLISDDDEEPLLNSSEFQSVSVRPEFTVNLPRITNANSKSIQQSVNDIISSLERETTTAKQELSKSPNKRSYPSEFSEEAKLKRPSHGKSSDLNEDFVGLPKNSKLLKCLLCENDQQVFSSYSILDIHIMSSHPKPHPVYFRCHYRHGSCKRHFRTVKRLYEHVRRRHVGEDLSIAVDKLYPGQRPWQCPIGTCRKIFAFNLHLRLHCRQVHPNSEEPLPPDGESKRLVRKIQHKKMKKSVNNGYLKLDCVICSHKDIPCEKFKTYHELDEHLNENHPDAYPFYLKCTYCIRHYRGLSWLNNHMATHHNSEPSATD